MNRKVGQASRLPVEAASSREFPAALNPRKSEQDARITGRQDAWPYVGWAPVHGPNACAKAKGDFP